jgi:energy-converting hydrogenase Eha subunit A
MIQHIAKERVLHIEHNPKIQNLGKMVLCIEAHVQEHPIPGIIFAFLSGIFGWIQAQVVNPSSLERFCKVIGQISIIIGFLIAIITLIIKAKEFYTTFFKKEKVTKPRRKKIQV